MAQKSDSNVGAQVVVAIIVLVIAWAVLKWVVKVVAAVATTVVVLGLLAFAAWLFLGRQNRASN